MNTPGLIVAPLTPFTADLTVDEGGLKRQIDYVGQDCRAPMVVAAGVETQEYTYLSFEQRKALIQRTVELTDGRVPVMVGISHASFRTAIELAHFAERLPAPPPPKPTSLPISRRSRGKPDCRSRSISTPGRAPTSRSRTPSRSPNRQASSSSRKARAIWRGCRG